MMTPARTKTAILGMGRTGCSVARFLLRQGYACAGFDEHRVSLPEDLNIPLHIGSFQLKKLGDFQRIVVSPGIAWQHPVVKALREQGIDITSDLDLFLEHFDGEILAVTGTNGKTTTVSMIGTLLEVLPEGIDVGGNIGKPVLDLLKQNHTPRRVALELSSFQLERCRAIRPCWAVLLNLQPDHADMHLSASHYRAAKLRLFEQQAKGDTAMLPKELPWNDLAAELKTRQVRVRRFGRTGNIRKADAGLCLDKEHSRLFWTQEGKKASLPMQEIPVRGVHQCLNLAVAAQAAADFGVSRSVISEALSTFRGLPHRLQYIGHFAGKAWYDDSKATNPASALAALNSFDHALWICGGLLKGLDPAVLESAAGRVEHAYIIGRNYEPFARMLDHAGVPFSVAKNMHKAVQLAAKHPAQLPVVLSPAAASQDQFSDYAERGRVFADAVAGLKKAA